MPQNLRTPIGVMSFPVLFTPRTVVSGGELRYSLNLLFDTQAQKAPEYSEMKRAVAQAIDEKFGAGKSQDRAFIGKLRLPFLPCKDMNYEGYDIPGGMFIRPWTKQRPGIVDAQRTEVTVSSDVWSGQLVRCTVAPFAYEMSGNRGVSFALNNVQICRTDTKRIDGRKRATDDFPDYDSPEGQLATADDDIPF